MHVHLHHSAFRSLNVLDTFTRPLLGSPEGASVQVTLQADQSLSSRQKFDHYVQLRNHSEDHAFSRCNRSCASLVESLFGPPRQRSALSPPQTWNPWALWNDPHTVAIQQHENGCTEIGLQEVPTSVIPMEVLPTISPLPSPPGTRARHFAQPSRSTRPPGRAAR